MSKLTDFYTHKASLQEEGKLIDPHLKPQKGLSERYLCRALDVTLAAKLTLTYGKYHLAMLHRQLA